MRVLVVGAGAVGQVFGWHLHHGGAEVGFLVKPGRRPESFRLQWLDRGTVTTWDRFVVYEDPAAVGAWDALVIAVASTSLDPAWLAPLGRATGDAVVAVMQPGPHDLDLVGSAIDRSRLVRGLIGLIAFQTPLAGDPRFPDVGVAYWFAPLVKTLLEGDRARPLVEAFRRGALPVALSADVRSPTAFGGAALQSHVAALELEGWSFAAARAGRWMGVASRATRQLAAVAAQASGARPPWALALVSPATSALAARASRLVMPFDVEAYLRAHFTKVGAQTLANLEASIADAHGLPIDAVEELVRGLRAVRTGANYTAT
jgi:2-dehydropantoate 2-reductase